MTADLWNRVVGTEECKDAQDIVDRIQGSNPESVFPEDIIGYWVDNDTIQPIPKTDIHNFRRTHPDKRPFYAADMAEDNDDEK